MCGELDPTEGTVRRHASLRLGRYYQHSAEQLPLSVSPLDHMRSVFCDGVATREGKTVLDIEEWRMRLGVYGVTGSSQTSPMRTMSNGMLTRVVFALMATQSPHILLLDEPTNHMDMGTIDSLADAINAYPGGLLLISHDFRLISQVAKEIWMCDEKKVYTYKGDIMAYKKSLATRMAAAAAAAAAPKPAPKPAELRMYYYYNNYN